ncbi:trypsin alpha-like [Drosophila subpulchrella]|uniref:trypsin alpha-like n=1 Tax=Drosophila subpulchrella TaxID=1486046 RepID=UPI0018A15CF3|nr:trypsin alpha-like [Drosophila subpulchrella]
MFFKYIVLSAIAILASAARIPEPEERIVGGHHIPIEYVPWQVSLLGYANHFCGGSIYSDRVILTAAHCLVVPIGNLSVRAGSSHWSKGGQVVKVLKAISHPKYKKYPHLTYDVAVLILESPLKFSAYVQKIALAEKHSQAGNISFVSGWGDTRYGAKFGWPILQGVHVALYDPTVCKNSYGEHVICTDAIGRTICNGDSGGPLVSLPDRKLIGIVSKGYDCGRLNPGIYADVVFFRNWFIDTINKNLN